MNSKKIILFIALTIGIIFSGIFLYNYFKPNSDSNPNTNYFGTRLNSTNDSNYNISDFSNNSTNQEISNNSTINITESQKSTPSEEEISSYTTKIYTKDSDRQNNITLTCSSLNDTIIANESTFSFCDAVGKSTSAKGYEKADVFKDGKIIKALGGGNCQVSTTLYNAVLNVPELDVTERHQHSNSVPYIENGKDAAVAYGSYDFKFVNHIGTNLKIKAEHTENEVIIKLIKINS